MPEAGHEGAHGWSGQANLPGRGQEIQEPGRGPVGGAFARPRPKGRVVPGQVTRVSIPARPVSGAGRGKFLNYPL